MPRTKRHLAATPAAFLLLISVAAFEPGPVEAEPPACPVVSTGAVKYTPPKAGGGARAPGVRARMNVSEPSLLTITPALIWGPPGHELTAHMGARTLADAGTRVLRIPTPGSLGNLTLGDKVTLQMHVSAAPDSAPGCTNPTVRDIGFKTRIVVVRDDGAVDRRG